MGRRQQSSIPITLKQLQPVNQEELKRTVQRRDEEIPKAEEYKRVKSKTLDKQANGEKVLVKHHKTGCWDTEATVIVYHKRRARPDIHQRKKTAKTKTETHHIRQSAEKPRRRNQ